VCCRVLQFVAVRCSALQCDAVFGSVLQSAVCCRVQCAAACSNVLKCVAECCPRVSGHARGSPLISFSHTQERHYLYM